MSLEVGPKSPPVERFGSPLSPALQTLFLMTHSSLTGTRECRKCGVHSSNGWHLNTDAIHLCMWMWAGCPGKAIFIYQTHICVHYLILKSWSSSLALVFPSCVACLCWLEVWECTGLGAGESGLGQAVVDTRIPGALLRTLQGPDQEGDAKRLVIAWSSVFIHRD